MEETKNSTTGICYEGQNTRTAYIHPSSPPTSEPFMLRARHDKKGVSHGPYGIYRVGINEDAGTSNSSPPASPSRALVLQPRAILQVCFYTLGW